MKTLELLLQRQDFTDKSTISQLFANDVFFSYILEDPDRGLRQDMPLKEIEAIKVYGNTCIPYGRYKVILSMSQRMKRILPLILDVPGYSGIRMHKGNRPKDTLGCTIFGYEKGIDTVYQSTKAEEDFIKLMEQYDETWITITKFEQP